jgi:RimJ/RimL family protein N-acetyltransferase
MPKDTGLPQSLWTARLFGRRPCPADGPALCLILQDARAMRWLSLDGRPLGEARVAWLLDRLASHWTAHDFGVRLFFAQAPAAVLPRPGEEPLSRFVGWCGLRHQILDGRPEIELLYALRPTLWRRRLGTEMARACLAEGVSALGVESVVAFTLPDNLGSRGVMEACGMTLAGSIDHAGAPHVLYRFAAAAAGGG